MMWFASLQATGSARRRRARRLSDAVRASLIRPAVADDEGTHDRTTVVGVHPVRVLLFGSGPLIGYGVEQRHDAIDGPLAQLVADGLGRGVTVERRVRVRSPIREAVRSLGGAGTATFCSAVWAPQFGEELVRAGRSRADVRAMLHEFREQSDVPLVLCELPVPLGSDWRTLLRRPRVARFNQMLAAEARASTRVTVVAAGGYEPATAATTVGREWHHALAARVAPAVLASVPHLRASSGTRTASGSPAAR